MWYLCAQHLGKDARRVDLRGIGRRQIALLRLRLEGDSQETAVQVHENHRAVGPDGIAGVIGYVRFGDNAENLPEAIDQEVIAVVLLHHADHGLADALEPCVFVGGETRLVAFGGVIHDAGRLRTPLGLLGVNIDDGGALIDGVKQAPLIGGHKAVVNPQSIAVRFEIVGLIHQPNVRDDVGAGGGNMCQRTEREGRLDVRSLITGGQKTDQKQGQAECRQSTVAPGDRRVEAGLT